MEVIVLSVHGIHGPISHSSTKSAWKKLSFVEKMKAAVGVEILDPCLVAYRRVSGGMSSGAIYRVDDFDYSILYNEVNARAFVEDLVGRDATVPKYRTVSPLATAIWLKQNFGYEVDEIVGGVELVRSDVNQELTAHQTLSRVVDLLKPFMLMDVTDNEKPVLKAQGLGDSNVKVTAQMMKLISSTQQTMSGLSSLTSESTRASVVETLDSVKEASVAAKAVVDDIRVTSSTARNFLESASLSFETLVADVKQALEGLVPNIALFASDLAMCLAELVYGCMKRDIFIIVMNVSRFLMRVGVAEYIVEKIKPVVRTLLEVPMTVSEEGFNRAQGIDLTGLSPLVALVMGTALFKFIPQDKDIKRVVEFIRTTNVSIPFINNMSHMIEGLLHLLPLSARAWFNVMCPEAMWKQLLEFELPDFFERVAKFNLGRTKMLLMTDESVQCELEDLRVQCRRFKEMALNNKTDPKLFAMLRSADKILEECRDIVETVGHEGVQRIDPYCIYIVGDSRIGKTHITGTVAACLAPEQWPRRRLLYTRVTGNDYWDGYAQHFAVLYDDFGQCESAPGGGEFIEAFSVINSADYRVPMASLDNPVIGMKATPFSSQLVIMTSNSAFPCTGNKIAVQQALWNRRNCVWEARLKDEYRDKRIDEIPPEVLRVYGHLEWQQVVNRPPTGVCKGQMYCDVVDTREFLRRVSADFIRFRGVRKAGIDSFASNQFVNLMRAELYAEDLPALVVAQAGEDVFVSPEARQHLEVLAVTGESQLTVRQRLARILETLHVGIKDFERRHPVLYKIFMALPLVLGSVAFVIIAIVAGRRTEEPCVAQSLEPKDYPAARRGRGRQVVQATARAHGLGGELSFEGLENMRELRSQLGEGCLFLRMCAGDARGLKRRNGLVGFALGIDYVLMPKHLVCDEFGQFLDNAMIEAVSYDGVVTSCLFDEKRARVLRDASGNPRDMLIFKFGPRLRPRRKRVGCFITRKELAIPNGAAATLITYDNKNKQKPVLVYHDLPLVKENVESIKYHYGDKEDDDESNVLLRSWEYKFNTVPGDCGSLIFSHAQSLTKRVIGVHICGYEAMQKGYAEVITQEDLLETLATFPGKPLCDGVLSGPFELVAPVDKFDVGEPMVRAEGSFEILGRLPNRWRLRLPDHTSLVPSLFVDKFQWNGEVILHKKEPAVLSPQDPRLLEQVSPLEQGIKKYGTPCLPMRFDLLEDIARDILEELRPVRRLRVLSEHEAINGIVGQKYFDSINMQSSPGWPFKLWTRLAGKKELFVGSPRNYTVADPMLRKMLDLRLDQGLLGNRVPSAWVDCLKDEKRLLAKVALGKTRVFAIAPVDYVITMRRLCLDFTAAFYAARDSSFSAVGINVASLEWNAMVKYLLENSDVGFAGDFGSFDGKLSAECMDWVCWIIEQMYDETPEMTMLRRVLFDELIHTVHIAIDCVYICSGGNPSGNPLTVVLNTIVNEMYLRYVWLCLAPKGMNTLVGYHQHVRTKVYGDDNWVSVTPRALKFYNLQTVGKFLGLLGFEYLPPTKVVTDIKFDSLLAWDFLQHRTFVVPEIIANVYVARVEMDVVVEMLYWTHKALSKIEAVAVNSNTALRFMFFYGASVYLAMLDELRRLFVSVGLKVPSLLTWRELKTEFQQNAGLLEYGWVTTFDEGSNDFAGVAAQGLPLIRAQMMKGEIEPGVESGAAVDPEISNDVHNKLGIALTEHEAPVRQDATRGMISKASDRAHKNMQDKDWTLADMAVRFNYVVTAAWNTGMTVNTVVYSALVPTTILNTATIQVPFNRFVYWRGNVRLRFQINATRFHQGRLIAYFVPLTPLATVQTWHQLNQPAQTSVQHVFLDPSVNTIAELFIPFVNFKNYILNNVGNVELNGLGVVQLQVFNPLQVGGTGGTVSVNVVVMASLEDSEFKIPVSIPYPPGVDFQQGIHDEREVAGFVRLALSDREEKPLRQAQAASFVRRDLVGFDFSYKDMNISTDGFARSAIIGEQKPLWRAQGNLISVTNNKMQNCSQSAMPIEMTGDSFDVRATARDVSAPIAMDKVNVTVQPPYVTRKAIGYMNHANNLEFLDRLAIKPSSLNLVGPEHFGTVQDEMEFEYIFSMPTFLQTINWPQSSLVNDVLAQGVLAPGGFAIGTGPYFSVASTSPSPTWFPTMLEYATLPFSFWRGGFRFHFDFVATGFHSGRLWLGIHYGVAGTPGTLDGATAGYGVNIDVSPDCHHFTYDIPYLSGTDYKRVVNGQNIVGIYGEEYFTGVWSLRVVNPLVMTENVFPAISINMFVGGMEDYEVAGLHMNNVSWNVLQAQGVTDQTNTSTMSAREEAVLIATQPQVGFTSTQFGEKYNSVREIIRRYALTSNNIGFSPGQNAFTNETVADTMEPYLVGAFDVGIEMGRGTMGWFASMFRAWRGSIRFKVMYENISAGASTAYANTVKSMRPFLMLDTSWTNKGSTVSTLTELDRASMLYSMGSQCLVLSGTGDSLTNTGTVTNALPNIMDQVGGAGLAYALPMWRSPPVSYALDEVPYSEIEVPFCTMYNILLTPCEQLATITGNKMLRLISPGTVYVGMSGWAYLACTNAAKFGFQVFTAAGDDFRLGLLLGPHQLVLNSVNTGAGQQSFGYDNY